MLFGLLILMLLFGSFQPFFGEKNFLARVHRREKKVFYGFSLFLDFPCSEMLQIQKMDRTYNVNKTVYGYNWEKEKEILHEILL